MSAKGLKKVIAMAAGEVVTLEYTPTWVVAFVCTIIVAISLLVERLLHYAGKYALKKNQKPLYQALLKIKEELMLLGFISLLLTVFQDSINKICIPKHLTNHWLPCKNKDESHDSKVKSTAHFETNFFPSFLPPGRRRLLAEASAAAGYCEKKGKAPLLSITALHHLHIFIFVLAVSHVIFCALTILIGGAKIRQWKRWEDAIHKRMEFDHQEEGVENKVIHVQDHAFIRGRFLGIGKNSAALSWLHSFFKQFYGSVNKSDYATLRLGFIKTHCPGNPKFNFHKYITRAFEADFKKVVGISWYLWIFVVVFLLLNVYGWHAYFWISFVPFALLLAVATKLEHVITQLANEVAEKHVAVQGDLIVKPSDDHFWFRRPKLVLLLIHVILFQNAFEIAVFFWTWVQYGFGSCIMGKIGFVIPRLVVGVIVQFICSYSTLPLYAIVTQMGSSIKMVAFDEPIQEGLVGWAKKARKNTGAARKSSHGSTQVRPKEFLSSPPLQLVPLEGQVSAMEEGRAGEIGLATTSEDKSN